jgi:hypothetical protein
MLDGTNVLGQYSTLFDLEYALAINCGFKAESFIRHFITVPCGGFRATNYIISSSRIRYILIVLLHTKI